MHLIDLQTMQFGRRHRFSFVTISISAIAEFTDRIIPSTLKATDTKKIRSRQSTFFSVTNFSNFVTKE